MTDQERKSLRVASTAVEMRYPLYSVAASELLRLNPDELLEPHQILVAKGIVRRRTLLHFPVVSSNISVSLTNIPL